jgi:hypothetical protein
VASTLADKLSIEDCGVSAPAAVDKNTSEAPQMAFRGNLLFIGRLPLMLPDTKLLHDTKEGCSASLSEPMGKSF